MELAKQKLAYYPVENYETIVIATALKDYRVSFCINQSIHTHLDKADDITIDKKAKGIVSTFGTYFYQDPVSEIEYYLISNKSPHGPFLASVKNFDFVLLVKLQDESVDVPFITEKLRLIPEFQAALHANQLSAKDNKLIQKYI